MNIALTGGGTAGHVMPNMALLESLRARFGKIVYIGGRNNMEYGICQKYGVPFRHCDSVKFDRSRKLKNLKIPFVFPRCVAEARRILREEAIDVVFSKGGYVGLPVTRAAAKSDIPYVIHESDATLGLANRLAAKRACAVVTSDKAAAAKYRVVDLGNPLRPQLFRGNADAVRRLPQMRAGKPVLLVVGGSLGAAAINTAVDAALDRLLERFNVVHVRGAQSAAARPRTGYLPYEFADNVEDLFAAADIVVSRCGAGVSGELTALGKRVLYIPLPAGASRGDQVENAQRLQARGLAEVLPQEDLSPVTLTERLNALIRQPAPPAEYDRRTPEKIADLLLRAAKRL